MFLILFNFFLFKDMNLLQKLFKTKTKLKRYILKRQVLFEKTKKCLINYEDLVGYKNAGKFFITFSTEINIQGNPLNNNLF